MQTFGPLLEVARIQSEINELFENLLDLGDPARTSRTWTPSADIAESETTLNVTVELPAVEPGDLKVTAFGGQVIIEGEKRPPAGRQRPVPGRRATLRAVSTRHPAQCSREYAPRRGDPRRRRSSNPFSQGTQPQGRRGRDRGEYIMTESSEPAASEHVRIPAELPVLPLRDMVVYPFIIAPLSVAREISIQAVDRALSENRMILLAAQRDKNLDQPA